MDSQEAGLKFKEASDRAVPYPVSFSYYALKILDAWLDATKKLEV